MRLLTCILLLAGLAAAADVNGKWTGTLTPEGRDPGNAVLVLKQNGAEITGTAGPDDNQQWAIAKGKIDGNKITCEVPSPDGPVYKLSLVLDGEHLKGDVTGENAGGEKLIAKIDLTRAK